MINKPKCVVLLSSGLDSQTTLYEMQLRGYECHALHVYMGTKQAATQSLKILEVAKAAGVELEQMNISGIRSLFVGSALVDQPLPTNRTLAEMEAEGINPTYMPARNTILLALAASFAEGIKAQAIAYGAHASDGVHYADTTVDYFKAIRKAIRIGTAAEIETIAPFIEMSKEGVIRRAAYLKVPVQLSYTCYAGTEPSCGVCDSCVGRMAAFRAAGYMDPIDYKITSNWGDKQWPTR